MINIKHSLMPQITEYQKKQRKRVMTEENTVGNNVVNLFPEPIMKNSHTNIYIKEDHCLSVGS